jgi:hypothetical protein
MLTDTISSIKERTDNLVQSFEKTQLSEEQKINIFLDTVNQIKKPIEKATKLIEKLDEVVLLVTWVEVKTAEDEQIVREILEAGHKIHKEALKSYAGFTKILSDKTFKNTLRNFKAAIDDFEDSLLEVKEVIFDLRKDSEFMKLSENL